MTTEMTPGEAFAAADREHLDLEIDDVEVELTRGQAFAAAAQKAFELEIDELELLVEVQRTIDTLDQLQAVIDVDGPTSEGSKGQTVTHPALSESRQARVVLSRLLAQLGLAMMADDTPTAPLRSGYSVRSSQAARTRWGRDRPRSGA